MHTDRNQANTEISLLREQVKSLEKPRLNLYKHIMKKSVKDKYGEDQMRNADELIRQNIYSRRWNLIIYGIEKSEREDCPAEAKNVMLFALK